MLRKYTFKGNKSKENKIRSKLQRISSAQQGDTILLYCLRKVEIKKLTPYRHLNLIEGILQHIICVQFIDDFQESFHLLCPRLTDHKELCPCQRSNYSFKVKNFQREHQIHAHYLRETQVKFHFQSV